MIGQHMRGLLVDGEGSACLCVADAFRCPTLTLPCKVERNSSSLECSRAKKGTISRGAAITSVTFYAMAGSQTFGDCNRYSPAAANSAAPHFTALG